ncbi:MAG: hypothetical protein ACLFRY_04300 [Spirochaetia bacterium]
MKGDGGLKRYIMITLGLAAVAVIITVAAMLPGRIQSREEREAAVRTQEMAAMKIDLTELKIPEEYRALLKSRWYPFRPRMEQWNRETASQFWVDPKEIGADLLAEENTELIRDLFEEVP